MRKSLLLAAVLAFAPVAAFAATAATVAKSPAVVTTTDNTAATPKPAPKGRHHMLVKKQNTKAKMSKSVKLPATKA
jgi:hypothetical protein